jgi:hypothetical protein
MNQPPSLPDPPFGDDTDEAFSALADGELAAFADERGLSEAAARARLETWPGAAAKLEELGRVRASVQTPIAPLDDVTRHRLVREATHAALPPDASAPRSRRWRATIAIAAAGLVVVAGIGVAISSMGGGGDTSSSESSASRSTAAPLRGDVGDLGDVTSEASLRALLDRRAAAQAEPKRPATSAPDSAYRTAAPTPAPAGALVQPEVCAHELAGSRDVTFSGTGTYRGAPVTIVGIDEGRRTIVFVVSSTRCTDVLASISR